MAARMYNWGEKGDICLSGNPWTWPAQQRESPRSVPTARSVGGLDSSSFHESFEDLVGSAGVFDLNK